MQWLGVKCSQNENLMLAVVSSAVRMRIRCSQWLGVKCRQNENPIELGENVNKRDRNTQ